MNGNEDHHMLDKLLHQCCIAEDGNENVYLDKHIL